MILDLDSIYMHELGVNLDGEIVRSESENCGMISTK